jgi:hypothetical protein
MRAIVATGLILVAAPAFAAEFRAGAAAIDVTPEQFPVIVNGMFTERIATKALDRLHARALVLDDGATKIAICVVDSCMMPREFLDKAKEMAAKPTGIPVENMCISATHTHSAPAVMGCLGSDADPVYPEFLQRQIVRAITQANKALVPAKAGWAVTHAPNHTFNRRWILRSDKIRNDPFGNPTVRATMHPGYQNADFIGPSGPVDDALSLLALRTQDDKPLAVLANFSMHYFGSGIVSSDYFGLFCDGLEKKIGGGEVVLSQGTSGDLMWMDYGKPKSDMTMERYAAELVDIAHQAYRKIEYMSDVPLKMKETKLTLNRRPIPNPERLDWLKKTLQDSKGRKPVTQAEIYAKEAVYLFEEPVRELKLQAIRIGKGGICAIPNEVFAITGLHLKVFAGLSSLSPAMVIELANGAEGYIPSREQHDLGGYTTWPARTAALDIKAESAIVTSFSGLLDSVGKSLITFGTGGLVLVPKPDPNEPIGVWHLDESHGEPSYSSVVFPIPSVNGRYETQIARSLPGRIGQCVQFVGGRMIANLKDLGPTYTAEFWVWNGFPTNVRPVTGYVFSRGEDGDKQANGDHLGIGGTAGHAGKLIFFNGNAKNQTLGGKTELKLKEWYHVALVRDGKKVAVYLNGKEEIAGEAESTVPAKCGQIFFGGRCDKFAGLEGRMDEAAIYNRALPAKEIADHFAAAKGK